MRKNGDSPAQKENRRGGGAGGQPGGLIKPGAIFRAKIEKSGWMRHWNAKPDLDVLRAPQC